jgi:hypothetical protein
MIDGVSEWEKERTVVPVTVRFEGLMMMPPSICPAIKRIPSSFARSTAAAWQEKRARRVSSQERTRAKEAGYETK